MVLPSYPDSFCPFRGFPFPGKGDNNLHPARCGIRPWCVTICDNYRYLRGWFQFGSSFQTGTHIGTATPGELDLLWAENPATCLDFRITGQDVDAFALA
jgi:hypothetical protein